MFLQLIKKTLNHDVFCETLVDRQEDFNINCGYFYKKIIRRWDMGPEFKDIGL